MKLIKYILVLTLFGMAMTSFAAEGQVVVLEGGLLDSILGFFLSKFPQATVLFVIMGGLRAVFKPLTLAYEAYVGWTADKKDDERWGRAKESKVFKAVEKILDYIASVKLPAKK